VDEISINIDGLLWRLTLESDPLGSAVLSFFDEPEGDRATMQVRWRYSPDAGDPPGSADLEVYHGDELYRRFPDMDVVGPSAEGAFPLPHSLGFRIEVIGNAIEVHLEPVGSTIWARCPPGEQPFLEYEPPA
jgi:hypothetical protein